MRKVTIEVYNAGINFACAGIIKDARTGEHLESTRNYPHGIRHAAYAEAETIASERGWQVIESR